MNALILGLVLSQATVGVRISVQIVTPTCVVVDETGVARVVPKHSLSGEARSGVCTSAPEANAPRVEQRVVVAATGSAPEQRVIEVDY